MAELIKTLSALLTPLLAIIATAILVCQYRLARQRWRLDLYDKRYPVYEGTRKYLAHIIAQAAVDLDELTAFHQDCRDREFLFGKEVHDFLQELHSKGVRLRSTGEQLRGQPGAEQWQKLVQENADLLKWFGDQFAMAGRLFGTYLRIDKR